MQKEVISITNDEFYELTNSRTDLLIEVSQYAPKPLKRIDKLFRALKKDLRDIKSKKALIEELQKFTGIEKVTLSIKPNLFNAAVLPVYRQSLPKELFGTLKEILGNSHLKNVDPKKIKKMETVEESATHIEEVIVVFGENLIKSLTAEECTAILLHELGHVFSKTASWPYIIPFITKKIFYVSATLTTFLKLMGTVPMEVLALITFVALVGIHGLTFLERAGEYSADNYAARYGYGDDLASVLFKVKSVKTQVSQRKSFTVRIINIISNFIENIFFPGVHPDEGERIMNLKKRMSKEFKDLYPELDSEITYIFNKTAEG